MFRDRYPHGRPLSRQNLRLLMETSGFPIYGGLDDPRLNRLFVQLTNAGVHTDLTEERKTRVPSVPAPIPGEVSLGVGGPCTLGHVDFDKLIGSSPLQFPPGDPEDNGDR